MSSAYMEAVAKLQSRLKEQEWKGDEESLLSGDQSTDHESYGYSDQDTDIEEYGEQISFEEISKECVKTSGVYVGTDRSTVWMKQKLKIDSDADMLTADLNFPGPQGDALNVTDPISSWKVLFDDAIIETIVECTNSNIDKIISNFSRERDCKKTDSREIYALIGLLYLGGLFKSSHVNVTDLWSTDGTGINVFYTTMSYKRFLLLLRYMGFDDPTSVEERETLDNLAAIRVLLELFIANCQKSYSVGKYVTIDNMLVPYRGKCIFRQCMPKKAAKYGIKVFPLVDSCTLYTWNMEIYDSKQPEGPYKVSNSPEDIAKRLTRPLFKSGSRNLTTSSWFTSFPLAKDLLSEDITLVGVMKQNKPEVPSQLKSATKRTLHSSIFGFRDDATMVSYCPEKGKCNILLSTMHKDDAVDTCSDEKTPEILRFYNSTKGAVSTVEEMAACYSTSRITSRWPVVVFSSLLNIAALNARIILMSTKDPPLKYQSRRQFLKDLGLAMVNEHIKFRATMETLPRSLRIECAEISGGVTEDLQPPIKKLKTPKKGRCTLCPRSKDKKTQTVCFYCMRLICHGHVVPVCRICAEGGVTREDLKQTLPGLPAFPMK